MTSQSRQRTDAVPSQKGQGWVKGRWSMACQREAKRMAGWARMRTREAMEIHLW